MDPDDRGPDRVWGQGLQLDRLTLAGHRSDALIGTTTSWTEGVTVKLRRGPARPPSPDLSRRARPGQIPAGGQRSATTSRVAAPTTPTSGSRPCGTSSAYRKAPDAG